MAGLPAQETETVEGAETGYGCCQAAGSMVLGWGGHRAAVGAGVLRYSLSG